MRTAISKALSKVFHIFADAGMEKKLMVVFIFLISFPILLLSYISFQSYSNSIQTNTTEYVTEISEKMINKLDDYINDLKRISAQPLYSEDIQKFLQQPGNGFEKVRSLNVFIQSLNSIKNDASSTYLFDNYGNYYTYIKTDGLRSDFLEMIPKWKQLAQEADGTPVLVSTQEVQLASSRKNFVFSVVREIRNYFSLEPTGIIVFDTNIKVVEQAVQELDSVTKGKSLIVDDTNHVIFDSDKKMIASDVSNDPAIKRIEGEKGHFELILNDKPYLYTYTKSLATGWKVLVYLPKDELTKSAAVTRNVTVIATLVIVGFALFVSILISHALTSPLRKLAHLMKEVQRGNLDVRLNVKYGDEIGILGNHFNRMLSRIQELIGEVVNSQHRKREAEIKVLQSQINPHFIYNTLETIRMMAEINDDENVAGMAYQLGALLRYSIVRGDEFASLAQELEHLETYLYLQNVRFRERFRLFIQVDNQWMRYRLPKLTLQPIVENAIYHGLEKQEKDSEITIIAYVEARYFHIIIRDNGAGMNIETLQGLTMHIGSLTDSEDKYGIGLRNVNERIKLHFGEEYGLSLQSGEGEGTTVTLKLPHQA